MLVTKRNGNKEEVNLDKITKRIRTLSFELTELNVEPVLVAQKVISGVYDGVSTHQLDELAAQTAAALCTVHPDYDLLAARIVASSLHKETPAKFSEAMRLLEFRTNGAGERVRAIDHEIAQIVADNADLIDKEIIHDRDYAFDYLGISTLKSTYLLRDSEFRIIERPQYMWMRVALGIHKSDLAGAFESYRLMSQKKFTHATPTLFNAASPTPQMSSCFLLAMADDSITGIYKTLTDCAQISKTAGGIGVHIHNIRAAGSYIAGTNGVSNGIVPMLRNFDATANFVDQGGGKRKGSFAVYLEPWHADIFDFLDLKRNTGKDEVRCRALFYALWVSDLFMERVEADGDWTLFDPSKFPGLADCHGNEFRVLYAKYEATGKGKTIKARTLWKKICETQVETSMPYIMYKDACNNKSNQQNLGTIKSSNLCSEIVQYTSKDETAVCNLGSLALPNYIKDGKFDHEELHYVTKVLTRNLNKVIDLNYYPVQEAKNSNLKHRPIGIGVQGLADVFMKLRLNWDSDEARQLNKEIFETIYHASVSASVELARKEGAYSSFSGSPASYGRLQFDMAGVTPSSRYDWAALKQDVITNGLRNSLLVSLMPTASTASILGNTESFEPISSNIFKRNVLSGEFVKVNGYLVRDLIKLGIWSPVLKNQIVAAEGSIQDIKNIPDDIKLLYRTVWEISQKHIINLAADRQAFVCQSQSMNIYMKDASTAKLTSMHFYGWKSGLKTGSYYVRQTAARQAQKVTVEVETPVQKAKSYLLEKKLADSDKDFEGLTEEEILTWAKGSCSKDNPTDCLMCSG